MSPNSLKSIQIASIGTKELYQAAQTVRERAYAPYSRFKVGAAIRLTTGEILGGCNVENSSYGATVCAERVAIQKAISEHGKIQVSEVLVITETPDGQEPAPPCGLCRQVISEFSNPGILVHLTNTRGEIKTLTMADLLPHAFTSTYLG